jgi:hypothetical protein
MEKDLYSLLTYSIIYTERNKGKQKEYPMKAGTVVRFMNRRNQNLLLAVLAVDNDWAHCVYYGEKGETKDGWFRTEMLKEVK